MAFTLSSFCYALGYITAVIAFLWMARRRNLLTSGIVSLMVVGLIGGLFFANLTQWITTGLPGKTIIGGLAGGYLCVAVMKRRLGIRRPTGDLFAIGACAGEAVGRWGCFFAGCCYGRPTTVPWGVDDSGVFRHPTQIYLSLASAAMLAVLLRYDRTRPPENALFYLQGMLFCISRMTIEFFRVASPMALGLTAAQWACLAGLIYFTARFNLLLAQKRPEADMEPISDRPLNNESTVQPAA